MNEPGASGKYDAVVGSDIPYRQLKAQRWPTPDSPEPSMLNCYNAHLLMAPPSGKTEIFRYRSISIEWHALFVTAERARRPHKVKIVQTSRRLSHVDH